MTGDEAYDELLDARDVVEAADDFLTERIGRGRVGGWRQRDADNFDKLDAANRRYREKWGEKK